MSSDFETPELDPIILQVGRANHYKLVLVDETGAAHPSPPAQVIMRFADAEDGIKFFSKVASVSNGNEYDFDFAAGDFSVVKTAFCDFSSNDSAAEPAFAKARAIFKKAIADA